MKQDLFKAMADPIRVILTLSAILVLTPNALAELDNALLTSDTYRDKKHKK